MKRMVNVLFAGVLAMTVLSCGEEKKQSGAALKYGYHGKKPFWQGRRGLRFPSGPSVSSI